MSYEIHKPPTADRRASIETSGPLTPPSLDLDVERSVRMYPRLAWGGGLAVALAIGLVAASMKPMYTARTTVYVQPVSTKVLGETNGYYDPAKYESYLQQQMLTAVRPDILAGALADPRAKEWLKPGESMDAAVARLAAALKVARVQTSYEITFTVASPDQAAVAPMANAVTDAFLKLGRKDELSQTDQRMQLLSEERERIVKELESARTEQRQLGGSIGVASTTGNAGNPYDLQLTQLRTELASAREAHDVAAAQLQAVTVPGPSGLEAATEQVLAADPEATALKQTIAQKKATLVGQMAGLTPNNPAYKEYEGEVKQLDQQLESMTQQMRDKAARSLQDKLRLDLAKTGDVEARLNAQLARDTASATGATPKLQRAEDLAADIVRLEARYAAVDDAMRGLAIESNSPGLAHLAVPATEPASPDATRRNALLALALPLGLLFGTVAAVIARKQNPRVQVSADIQRALGFQPMAVLPAATDVSNRVLEEYVLRFAGGVDQAMRRGRARSYLLTAVSPSMDIAKLVHALSLRLDQLGFRTRVVRASAVLQPQPAVPVAEPLPLAAGKETAPGPLSSSALDRRDETSFLANVERLQQGQDLLLIESDPILASAETEYVARIADVTILVAESDLTLHRELADVAMLLKRLSASGVGAVLTEVKLCHADRAFRNAIRALEERKVTSGRFASDWRGYHSVPVAYPDDVKEYGVPRWQQPAEPQDARQNERQDNGEGELRQPTAARRPNGRAYVSTPARAESPLVDAAAAVAEAPVGREVPAAQPDPGASVPAPISAPIPVPPPAKPTAGPVERDEYAARLADAAAPRPVANPPVRPARPAAAPQAEPEPVVFPVGFTPEASADSGPACFAQYAAQLEASELLHGTAATPDSAHLAAEAAKIAEERIAAVRAARELVHEPAPQPAVEPVVETMVEPVVETVVEPVVEPVLERAQAVVPEPEATPIVASPEPAASGEALFDPVLQTLAHAQTAEDPDKEAARALEADAARRRAYLEARSALVDPSQRHFEPAPPLRRPVHVNDFAPEPAEETPHRSWVHRIFRRDADAAPSIAPSLAQDRTKLPSARPLAPVRPPIDLYDKPGKKGAADEPAPDRLSERLLAATQTPRNPPPAETPAASSPRRPLSPWDQAELAMQTPPAPEAEVAAMPKPALAQPPVAPPLVDLAAEAEATAAPEPPHWFTDVWAEPQAPAAPLGVAESQPAPERREFEVEPIATTILPEFDSQLHPVCETATPAEAPAGPVQPAAERPVAELAELPTAVYVVAKPETSIVQPSAPAAKLAPEEFEVSMPLVPMRADALDTGFDFGNELAAWRPLPLSEPQPLHDSFVRPAATSSEHRRAYLAAASPREVQVIAEPGQEEAPPSAPALEPVAATEPAGRNAASAAVESGAEATVQAPVAAKPEQKTGVDPTEPKPVRSDARRFHLLHQFDRPAGAHAESAASGAGGAR